MSAFTLPVLSYQSVRTLPEPAAPLPPVAPVEPVGPPARLLDHALSYGPLFELLAYTGLRIGEALGLTRADIDHDNGLIRVHRQLSRQREHAPLKTEAGRREVILAPALAKSLRERWLASRYKQSNDFVFANTLGRGLDYRDVGEGFRQAVKAAGLQAPGKLTLHSLRHGFASLLIAKGLNVVYALRTPVRARRSRGGREGGARGELRGDERRRRVRERLRWKRLWSQRAC